MSANNSKASSATEQHSKRSQSRASHTSSQLSGNSPTLTIASAHARLDGIETAVLSIQTMLTNMTQRTSTDNAQPVPATTEPPPAPEWPSIVKKTEPNAINQRHPRLAPSIQRLHGLERRGIILIFGALVLTQVLSPLPGTTPRVILPGIDTSAPVRQSVPPGNPLLDQQRQDFRPSTLLDFFPSVSGTADAPETDSSWGDSIVAHPEDNHRVYFQNVDGLRHDADEIDLYVSSMAHFHVGTFCWADPGLDFSDMSVRRSLHQPLRSHFTTARSAFSSSTLPPVKRDSRRNSSSYQPGGTFMATTGKWASRSTGKIIVDPTGLGRWSGLTFLGKRGKRLTVITAYRSPRQQPSAGFGFYDQQYALLLSQGFLAYDNGIFSKHRGLFIDIDFTELMGAVDAITPAPARGLNSENQMSVDRYLEALKKYCADHKIDGRVRDLVTVAASLTPRQCKESYDVIDRDITRAMIHAEKEAKRPSGKYAWSPKLREAGLLTRYWNLRLKELESRSSLAFVIARLKQRLGSLNISLVDDEGNDMPKVKAKWKESIAVLKKIRNSAFDYRAEHLHSNLAMYQALEPQGNANITANQGKIRRILQLLNTEQMRKPFRAIHCSMSTTSHGAGLSKLFVPVGVRKPKVASKFCQPDGSLTKANLIQMAQSDKTSVEYTTILDSEEIEHELMTYNRAWFRQAHETPFGHGELYDMVGYDGLTEEADNIKWKESTSTSPSGRHLGHYRTAILDDQVAALHTDMLNLPIQYGFAPDRWTSSVTPMIEKDDGKPYLTRLRVIHLFEADYNLFLKILFGKRLVRNGEISNALNDQQHGSRPRRMTTDALFLSRMEKDLIRQTKSNSAHMDNDATGCYDRIITSLGMIACRRLGMPPHVIRCQAETLFYMKYAVKHGYGISSNQYTSSPDEPLFGTGQGSGASPAIWLSLVVILLNSLDTMSKEDNIPALSFSDPWKEILAEWRVGAFVDDTNQGIVDHTGDLSPEALVEYLCQAGQMWERLLYISGGSLNLSNVLGPCSTGHGKTDDQCSNLYQNTTHC
ncbi:hypothetical protein MHU86_21130 [Fragilaria crotonensis]|nr:hypothetical protein MHU86_21130 [Fragilaria crotonensis]